MTVTTPQKPSAPYKNQSGNIFFAIFGAVAVVSLIGAGLMTFVRGPISSAVTVSRQSAAENQMVIGAQTALMNATAQTASGDCDTDLFVEPVPWKTPGAVPAPVGGGLIPNGVAAPKRDPWGADYGYCVWDHGPTVDDAACGGPTQNRLTGTNSRIYPSIAIISSGPDKIFQTTCRNFGLLSDSNRADQNDDGDLEDPGDFKLVDKAPGSDDLIFSYTYDEAVSATGDMWVLRSSNSVAALDKNLEIAGDALFSGGGDFIGVTGDRMSTRSAAQIDMPGIRLPDATTYNPSCSPALQGVVRTNLAVETPKAVVSAYSYARPFRDADTAKVSLNSLTTAGNSLIVVVRGFRTGGFELLPANVTDNQGNTYVQVGFAGAPGSDSRVMMFAAYNVLAPTGNIEVTINPTGPSASGTFGVLEVAGIDSGSLDIAGSSVVNNGAVSASGSTAVANELAIGVIGVFDPVANLPSGFVPTTGWTQPIVQHTDVQMSTVVRNIPTAGATVNHSWTYANTPQAVRKFVAVFKPSGTVVTCPAGYTTQLGKCYKAVNAPGDYTTARAACQSEGGDLISVNNTNEFNYLVSLIGGSGNRSWVGYTWNGTTHEWIDNTSTYTNWYSGEPNGGGTAQSCGVVYNNKLADEDCVTSSVPAYVCEHAGNVSGGSTGDSVTFEAVTTSIGDGSSVINKPAGTAVGDVLIWTVSIDNGNGLTLTWPNGFTQISYLSLTNGGDSQGLAMAYKVADGTEPSSFNMNIPSGANTTSTMLRYSNVNTTSPIDVSGTRIVPTAPNPTPLSGPNLTTTVPNTRVVWASTIDTNQDWPPGAIGLTQPAGFTEYSDLRSAGGWTFMNVADKAFPSTGATGNLDGQITDGTWGHSATGVIAVALKPAAGNNSTCNATVPCDGGRGNVTSVTPVDGFYNDPDRLRSVTLSRTPAAGEAIIVMGELSGVPASAGVVNVTDNRGNTYVQVATGDPTTSDLQCHGAAAKSFPFMYIANNIPAPAGPVTITLEVAGTSTAGNWGAMSVSGLQATLPLDKTGKIASEDRALTTKVTTSAPITSGNQFVVAVHTQDGAVDSVGNNEINYGVESGWKEVYTVNDPTAYSGLSAIYKNVKTPDSVSHTWSHFPGDSAAGPSCGRSAIIATFRTLDNNTSCLVDEGGNGTDGSGAPAYKTSSYKAGTGGSLNVPLPYGTTIGDLLIWSVSIDNGEGLTPAWPYGFTPIGYSSMASPDGQGLGVAWKIVDGSEPATLIANFGGTTTVSALSRYTGFNPANPIDVYGESHTANLGTQPWTVTGPALTTTVDNARVVWVSASDVNVQEAPAYALKYQPPSGFQERFDTFSDPSGAVWSHLTLADSAVRVKGNTGALVGTASDFGSSNQAAFGVIAFAIKPDPAAAIDDGYTPAAAPTAPVLRSSSSAFDDDFDGSADIAKPPGTNVGDLLIWIIVDDDGFYPSNINWAYGFTEITKGLISWGDRQGFAAAWKIADGTEPAMFHEAFGDAVGSAATMLRYTGYDPVQPIETSKSVATTGTLPFAATWPAVANSITTTVPNTRVVWFATTDTSLFPPNGYSVTYQPPLGFQERAELQYETVNMAISDKIFPLAGATGPLNGQALDNWAAVGGSAYDVNIGTMAFGIRPGAGGGGSDQAGAIEFVGSSNARSGFNQDSMPPRNNVNISVPKTIISGDLIVLAQSTDLDTYDGETTTITWPSGFTQGGNIVATNGSQQLSWAWKVATGAERTLTVVSSRSWQTDLAVSVYRGVDPLNPIGANSGYIAANDTDTPWLYSVPGVTVPKADSSLVLIPFADIGFDMSYYAAQFFTAPATFNERVNSYYAPNNYAPLAIFDRMGVAAGATGAIAGSMKNDRAAIETGLFAYVGGFLLSLNPGDSRNAGGGPATGAGSGTQTSCDGSASLLQMCDGSGNWRSISGSGRAIANNDNSTVCGEETLSVIRYNTSSKRPEYCNGASWQSFTLNDAGVVLMATPSILRGMDSIANQWGATQTVTITNRGSQPSGPLTIGLTGPDINKFDYAGLLGTSTCDDVVGLDPGETCIVAVAPRSATDGKYSANLEVTEASSTAVVAMSGNGSQNGVCAPGKAGWGGIVVSCLDANTPYYVINPADCGTGTNEPSCTNLNGDNDPRASMVSGAVGYSAGIPGPLTQSPQGDINTRGLLSYGTYAAARACEDLVKDGYDNWYLPSSEEWKNLLYPQRSLLKFANTILYWTSTSLTVTNPYNGEMPGMVISTGMISDGSNPLSSWRYRCMRKHGASIPAVGSDTLPYVYPDTKMFPTVYTSTPGSTVTSAEVFVTGINASSVVTASGNGTPQFRIRDAVSGTWGAYGTSGNVKLGDKLQIQVTAPAVAGQETAIMVRIGESFHKFLVRSTQVATRRIFVTSQTWNGSLGGLSGADTKCQAAATAQGLGSTWIALLGDKDTSAFDRVPWNWNRLELRSGTLVVTNMDALESVLTTLPTSINRNELNAAVAANQPVWTGMKAGSQVYLPNRDSSACYTANTGSWTSTSSSLSANSGRTGNVAEWMAYQARACNQVSRLYCMGPF